MQLTKVIVPATAHARRWLLPGGVAALALGASPASAELLVWPIQVQDGYAQLLQARAADAQPAVVVAAGMPSAVTQGGTEALPAEVRAAGPPVLEPEVVTPVGPDALRAPIAPVQRVTGFTTRSLDFMPIPSVLEPDEVTPGDTDVLAGKQRRAGPPVLEPEVVTPVAPDALPVPGAPVKRVAGFTTRSLDLMPIPSVLEPNEVTPGDAGVMQADGRGPLMPDDVTPGDADLLPHAARASLPASVQRWTAFATFEHAGSDLVAFNVANRLSLSTLAALPAPLASLDLPGFVLDIEVVSIHGAPHALVAMGADGVAVVDLGHPAQPRLVAGNILGASGAILALATDGTTLWMVDADFGLQSAALADLLGPAAR